MSFFQDFIANSSDFNRKITSAEYNQKFLSFPNANIDNIRYIGPGYIKPSTNNCYKYHCFPITAVLLYNASGIKVASFEVIQNDLDLVDMIWNKCNSPKYKCVPLKHFGATYNCIGWAMGISKWLEPAEISGIIRSGKTKNEALELFIKNKRELFPDDHVSNIDKILNKFNSFNSSNHITNNTVAFYFNNQDECLHGSRFVESINNYALGKWTSKLGSDIMVSHNIEDLIGDNSIYGNNLHYININNNPQFLNDEL